MTARGETLTHRRELDRLVVDAIREVLGLPPLYLVDHQRKARRARRRKALLR